MYLVLSHPKMFRLRLLLLAIAPSILFLPHQSKGVRVYPTVQEENYSLAKDLLHGLAKRKLTSLKSNSIPTTIFGQDSSSAEVVYFATHHSYSGGSHEKYYGLLATMDVYGLELKHGQWSSTSVWVTHNGDGSKSSYNSVIVGWHIYPELYGDSRPRFHTYWTRDGYQATGCFNMDCPGFIAADGAMVAPGAVISPVSDAKNGHLQNITLKVFKDKTSGDWWIYYGFNSVPTAVGYYPKSLFTSMAENANQIKFGAFAASARTLPSPPIGNGVLPYSGQGRAASFTNLSLVDQDGRNNPIMDDLPTVVSNSQCYSVTPIAYASFFYGGPGSCI